jgi:hypothetical protein
MKKVFLFCFLFIFNFQLNAQSVTDLLKIHDTRNVNDAPNFLAQRLRIDLKARTTLNVPGSGSFSSNITLAPWSDASGGLVHQLNFNDGGMFYRTGVFNSGTWNPWRKIFIESAYGGYRLGEGESASLGEGTKLYFLGASDNTDQLWICRYNGASDVTDLRVNIGDNRDDSDRFVLGSTRTTGIWDPFFVVTAGGKVGINVSNPQNALDVNGTIRAKEVKVETGWADFVFHDDYHLKPLSEVNKFIKENKHLPEIPTEAEVKENDGVNLGEMQTKLLQKIEELTLYLIQQQETIEALNAKVEKLENEKK